MRWNVSDIYKVEWRPKINAFSIAYRGVRDVIIWKLLNYNEDTSSCNFTSINKIIYRPLLNF